MRYCKIREKELQEENQKLKDKNISLEKVNCENWKTQEKENQKLKDMNKQLMKEIQWEDKVLKTIGILGLILELESYKGNIEIDLVKLLKFLKEVKE